ncbi:type I-C CRISPR-associated protein Cas7/Csd2 [Lachnobacterium bovis]|uniref:CRISPR-associated protein Csd2 n=1 Tax=Lachnobacterium bovis DSM 14045 TaxID=1122142 RepID=A0A1H3MPE2_9FIRM|nr:type I-C CRISPR-associated protein Cas7/Csd2 [Lachnobacterium bovis]SDY78537.1 CRISPR-associated protein Csd2 [Lachnobacterium bovis DSM 14045]
MSNFNKKIDFVSIVTVKNANPNGDPLNGNRPRTDYDGLGEISDVCIKRKIRNRMIDLGKPVFVQSEEKKVDEYKSLSDRAQGYLKGIKDRNEYEKKACETWLDVRSFGQVFAFKSKDSSGVSVGVRGPVSIHQAESVSPVEIESMQITKSVNSETKDGKSSDTMGMKHYVKFGVYIIKGSINVQLAEKTGFTEDDALTIKECLRTLFINDSSSARPDGSMEVNKIYWMEHSCKDGDYSSKKVHDCVKVTLKDDIDIPKSFDDYNIEVTELPNVKLEIVDGI